MGLWSAIKSIFVDPRMEADEKVPLRRFTRSAIAIITGGDDYGYFPKERVAPVLREMWDITDKQSAEETIKQLADGTSAWDLVRALHVTRMAVGAELIDVEQGWLTIAPVANKLQKRFESWDAVAADYYENRVAWAKETGADMPSREEFESEIDTTRSVYWDEIDFKFDLSKPAF